MLRGEGGLGTGVLRRDTHARASIVGEPLGCTSAHDAATRAAAPAQRGTPLPITTRPRPPPPLGRPGERSRGGCRRHPRLGAAHRPWSTADGLGRCLPAAARRRGAIQAPSFALHRSQRGATARVCATVCRRGRRVDGGNADAAAPAVGRVEGGQQVALQQRRLPRACLPDLASLGVGKEG